MCSAYMATPGSMNISIIITPNNPIMSFLKRLIFTIPKCPEATSNHLPITARSVRKAPITTNAKQMNATIDRGSIWRANWMFRVFSLLLEVRLTRAKIRDKRLNNEQTSMVAICIITEEKSYSFPLLPLFPVWRIRCSPAERDYPFACTGFGGGGRREPAAPFRFAEFPPPPTLRHSPFPFPMAKGGSAKI